VVAWIKGFVASDGLDGLKGRRSNAILYQQSPAPEHAMTQTSNRFFDEVARLMNDAAGVAQGVRREFDTLVKTQTERWLRDLDLIKREEFEAVKDMARLARDENEALKARVAALEAKLAARPAETGPSTPGPSTSAGPASTGA
jgi:BMFP domain-containing protein YqiC